MESAGLKDYIKYNLLTTFEVAEILKISKPRISKLVEKGDIVPVKRSSQGMLFLRMDIDTYQRKKELILKESYDR